MAKLYQMSNPGGGGRLYRRRYSEDAISKEVDCLASSLSKSVSAFRTMVFIGCSTTAVLVISSCVGTENPAEKTEKIFGGAGYPRKINRVRDNRVTHIARASALLDFRKKRAPMLDLELEAFLGRLARPMEFVLLRRLDGSVTLSKKPSEIRN